MKKVLISFLVILLVFPLISALDLDVKQISNDEVMIAGVNRPATFLLKVTNNGPEDNIEFYNLLGFDMFPIGTVPINGLETKEIELQVSPIGNFDHMGPYTFKYFIRGQDNTEVSKTLTFKRIELKEAFEVGSGEFDPESNSIELVLINKVNFDFGEVTVKFSSSFFDVEKSFTIGPYETQTAEVKLNKEDFKKLLAGFYTLDAEIQAQDQTTEIQGQLKFVEKNIVETTQKDYGIIVSTQIIQKQNQGNVIAKSETTLKKNIISRLFTSFNPEPDQVERKGLVVHYTWHETINPGETLEISVKTNWLFPLLIILLIIAIVILAKQYSKTNLVIKKKVSFVRAKGGEFALKITLFVQAKKYVEKITLVERLPPLVKLYERFGRESPSKVDEKKKRIEWNFEKLEAGETRIITYVVYSKVGVLGKFALPSTTGLYEKDGKLHETTSNRAFFITDQRQVDEE